MTTNYEKIKSMSIDEMAMAFDDLNVDCTGYHCPANEICEQLCKTENITSCFKPFKQWLQAEFNDNTHRNTMLDIITDEEEY